MHDRFCRLRGFPQRPPDYRQEFGIVHGLLEKSYRPRFDGALSVCASVTRGNNNDGNQIERRNFFEPFHHDEAVAGR
jgi:hypothetical protein